MERKINNLEEHVTFLYDELEKKEVETDNLKESLEEAKNNCRIKSASHSNDQEDISDLKKVIEEQKIKISCLRKHRNEIFVVHGQVLI